MEDAMEPKESEAEVRVDDEAIRKRAYELAQERPEASAEENWLRAEAELRAAAGDARHPDTLGENDRLEAERRAAEEEASLRAKIEMTVYEHP